jgi:hypothetical protein
MSLNYSGQPIDPFKLVIDSHSQISPTYLSLLLINSPFVLVDLLPKLMLTETVGFIIFTYIVILAPVLVAIKICFIHGYLKHQTLDLNGAVDQALSRIGPLILGVILLTIGIMLGLILLIIPGVYLSFIWNFTIYAIVLEKCSAIEGLKYSQSLVKGRWWPVFGSVLLANLFIVPPKFIGSIITEAFVSMGQVGLVIASVTGSIITILFTPLLDMYLIKLYLRVKDTANIPYGNQKI